MAFTTKELEQLDGFLKHGRFDVTGDGAAALHQLRTKLAQEHLQQKAEEDRVAKETNEFGRDNTGGGKKPKQD